MMPANWHVRASRQRTRNARQLERSQRTLRKTERLDKWWNPFRSILATERERLRTAIIDLEEADAQLQASIKRQRHDN